MNNKELAAALAHEVKNPLSLIKANVDIIRLETGGAYKRSIDIINRQIDKINTVIETFGNINVQSEKTRVSLTHIIKEITEEHGVLFSDKHINFTLTDKSSEPFVTGSENKLSILFFNLFKNAVEAVEDKGEINVYIYDRHGKTAIEIQDNGKGIEPYILENIGQPFLSGKEGGNGLGVAICKSIVREHKGEITFCNNEKGGCTVKVIL